MSTKNLVNKLNQLTNTNETLGSVIRNIRLCDEISLKDFATVLGVSVPYLSDVEHNRKIVSAKKAFEYAEKLGYPVTEFVRLALQDEANSFMLRMGYHANVALNLQLVS